MKRNLTTFGIVLAVLAGIMLINGLEPERKTRERLEEEQKAAAQLEMAEQAELDHAGHDHDDDDDHAGHDHANDDHAGHDHANDDVSASNTDALDATGLEKFLVELDCTNGKIVMEIYPEWSPLGVAQFVAAIEDGVYDEAGFFRVVPGFVVQFGLSGDPEKSMMWESRTIQDEPVITSNARGTITFAKSGAPNSRTTQMFINLGNNTRLDGMGFLIGA